MTRGALKPALANTRLILRSDGPSSPHRALTAPGTSFTLSSKTAATRTTMSQNTDDRPAVIQTRRLRLSELQACDIHLIAGLHNDPRVEALTIDRDYPMHEPEAAARYIDGMQKFYRLREGLGLWRCDLRVDDAAADADPALPTASTWRFCGSYTLMPLDHLDGQVELGCRLLPLAWGTGVAVEGGHALLRHAFHRVKLAEVHAFCHPAHRSVKFALLSLGFQAAGRKLVQGHNADVFCVNRSQWQQTTRLPARLRGRMAMMAARAMLDPTTPRGPAREPALEPSELV
jgi:RimJ/RimL family protein N-acetyltransferase